MTSQSQPLLRRGHPLPSRSSLPVEIPERLVLGVVGFVIGLVAWQAVVSLGVMRELLVGSPIGVVRAAAGDFSSGVIWPDILSSLAEWAFGFAIGIVVGIGLGFLVALNRRVELFLEPLLSAAYATPMVALGPMIILIFGVDLPAKVFTVFIFAVMPLLINTIAGVHSAERGYLDVARSFGAPRSLTLRSVILPSTVPYILTGLRIGAGHALVGMVVAEFLASNAGIGFFISYQGTLLHTNHVMLGIVLIGLFGVAIGEFIRRIERRFDVWRPAIH